MATRNYDRNATPADLIRRMSGMGIRTWRVWEWLVAVREPATNRVRWSQVEMAKDLDTYQRRISHAIVSLGTRGLLRREAHRVYIIDPEAVYRGTKSDFERIKELFGKAKVIERGKYRDNKRASSGSRRSEAPPQEGDACCT